MNAYEESNSIVAVDLNRFSKKYYSDLLNAGDDKIARQMASQKLISYLCDKFKMCDVHVIVTDKSQPRKKSARYSAKIGGFYKPSNLTITVYNKTSVKKQTVAIKSFAETLLHEFIHHYDFEYLQLKDSPHTTGFYKRITDLQNKLK